MLNKTKKGIHYRDDKRRIFWKNKESIKQYQINGNDVAIKNCLTKEEKKQIDDYFEKYLGKKITYFFHEAYKSYSGKFDVRYFPESVQEGELYRFLNPKAFVDVFEDKNMLPMLAKTAHVKMPKIIVYKIKDFYYDQNNGIITEEEAVELVLKSNSFVIKPSVDTHGGEGVEVIYTETLSKKDVFKLFKKFNTNFLIQECIKNSDDISVIHPESLNTIRIVTYIVRGEIKHVLPVLRLGVGSAKLDNATAGGIVVGVDNEGNLTDHGMKQYCKGGWIDRHPDSNIVFEGYHIENIDKVIEAAHLMHSVVPQVELVDWDFAINENGEPILIEGNFVSGGGVRMSQWLHGKAAFGDDTDYILKKIREVRNTHPVDRKKKGIYL